MRQPIFTLLILLSLLFSTVSQSIMAQSALFSANVTHDLQSAQPQLLKQLPDTNTTEDADECCDVPCCENECFCAANSCLLTLYLHAALFKSAILVPTETTPEPQITLPSTWIVSPFRPPILPLNTAVS